MDYDVFGNVVQDINFGFQFFGFVGGLSDVDIGLVCFGVCDYDLEVGCWIVKDFICFVGGDIVLYGYVGNDFVNYIDFNGNSRIIVWINWV